jgi:ribosomal protein S27E
METRKCFNCTTILVLPESKNDDVPPSIIVNRQRKTRRLTITCPGCGKVNVIEQ